MTLRLLGLSSRRHESTHHLGFLRRRLVMLLRCRFGLIIISSPLHLSAATNLSCATVGFRFANVACWVPPANHRRVVAVNGAGGCPCRCTSDVVLGSSYWVPSFHGPSFFGASWDRPRHPRFNHLLVGPP
ncbi:hypothetical protein Salat_0592400 [Sesamum alatum]|uniref:Uncharacterized protein n=1 Tax=Sesamum alatum TaxID=300844 RepID=A0AAE1YQS7_9LAMI|nr:hypothetical protein Salat_0592400 [Sesamum alatum]